MFPRVLAFIGLACVASAIFTAGCGDASTAGADVATPTLIQAFTPDASDASPPIDALPAAVAVQTTRGSSLCHATSTSCYPDDLVNACDLGPAAGDANILDAGEGGIACHVVQGSKGVAPACLPAGFGLDNSTCLLPTDCAVGHECVGSGACHQYCCDGNSACSANEFCDIQPTTHDPNLLVPVCMPEFPCTLLDNDSCPANQQCAVVRDDGSTSCIAIGPQRDGQSCEDAHCERGFMCLGPEGSRRCATLCYTASTTGCEATFGAAKTCTGALPLFLSPTVGVCQ
jgi:hypothetical protein